MDAINQNFVIPRDHSQNILLDLRRGKDIDSIGINGMAFLIPGETPEEAMGGIWVSSVETGTRADEAGILPGDIFLSLENLLLAQDGTMEDYCKILRSNQDEKSMRFEIFRYSTEEFLSGRIMPFESDVRVSDPILQTVVVSAESGSIIETKSTIYCEYPALSYGLLNSHVNRTSCVSSPIKLCLIIRGISCECKTTGATNISFLISGPCPKTVKAGMWFDFCGYVTGETGEIWALTDVREMRACSPP
jgi:hypothetical protein